MINITWGISGMDWTALPGITVGINPYAPKNACKSLLLAACVGGQEGWEHLEKRKMKKF